ncbi:RIP metalloprotease RseP [Arachidicoccus terrestris]|uniref:RIP metalloprotease RseP n=1 Tax=Arachidicoccus terrestris TaxID=2875539 RepID=UPI001CC6B31E|nr:RIP metalloprotease RseP [Arachidicoccus terrestris]UAY56578.1 RIP metalloprotease RseP [Arachidicoccus terrestris]
MTLLAIDWATVGIKAAQLILSLSILVVLHEFGHYITARWFKCRVEKFYLFFDPWFSLVKKKIGDTEYGIGWVPLGGYVKISGMIDESMDKAQMAEPAKPYEFRSKPAWQRLIIMLAGIIVNILLGFFIYSMMLWKWGDAYRPTDSLQYGIVADSLAQSVGLRSGDKILTLDGKKVAHFEDIPLKILLDDVKTIQVLRDGKPVEVSLPADLTSTIINKHLHFLGADDFRKKVPALDSVLAGSPAEMAGLKKGDKVVAFNGQPVEFWDQVTQPTKAAKGQQVEVSVLRGGDTANLSVHVSEEGTMGVYVRAEPPFIVHYTFLEALPAGVAKGCRMLGSYVKQLKILFGGKVNLSEGMSGPVGIANLFPATWDWQAFWSLTAFLSMILAIMNLLPIPALDGGHALFCIYEMITGRKPGEKFMEYAQTVGMIIILALMVFAFGNDIFRLFK